MAVRLRPLQALRRALSAAAARPPRQNEENVRAAWSLLQRANPFAAWGETVGREPSDALPTLTELFKALALSHKTPDQLHDYVREAHDTFDRYVDDVGFERRSLFEISPKDEAQPLEDFLEGAAGARAYVAPLIDAGDADGLAGVASAPLAAAVKEGKMTFAARLGGRSAAISGGLGKEGAVDAVDIQMSMEYFTQAIERDREKDYDGALELYEKGLHLISAGKEPGSFVYEGVAHYFARRQMIHAARAAAEDPDRLGGLRGPGALDSLDLDRLVEESPGPTATRVTFAVHGAGVNATHLVPRSSSLLAFFEGRFVRWLTKPLFEPPDAILLREATGLFLARFRLDEGAAEAAKADVDAFLGGGELTWPLPGDGAEMRGWLIADVFFWPSFAGAPPTTLTLAREVDARPDARWNHDWRVVDVDQVVAGGDYAVLLDGLVAE